MKNRAFKFWLYNFYGSKHMLAKAIPFLLMEQNRMMYEAVAEHNTQFTAEGYKTLAFLIFAEVEKEKFIQTINK